MGNASYEAWRVGERERERERESNTLKGNRQRGRQGIKKTLDGQNNSNSCLTSEINGVMPTIYKFNQSALMSPNKCTHSRHPLILLPHSPSLYLSHCQPSTIDQRIVRAFLSQLVTTHSMHVLSSHPLSWG